jgi:hypothetical protein
MLGQQLIDDMLMQDTSEASVLICIVLLVVRPIIAL